MHASIGSRLCLQFGLTLVLAASAGAQGGAVPTISLTKDAKEFPETFSSILQVVELRDGRVLLLDVDDKELKLVDLAKGTAAKVSRTGAGPLEYQVPGLLLTGAGDTITYYDVLQRRLLQISQAGAPIRTVAIGGSDAMAILSRMQPSSMDASGRIYGQTLGMKVGGIGAAAAPSMAIADTVEIQRLDRATGEGTPIAKIRNPISQSKPRFGMSGNTVSIEITAPDFRPADAWAVLPDGRLAILRDGVYRVHFVSAGRAPGTDGPAPASAVGPLIPFTPVPVTAAEKRGVIDSLQKLLDAQLKQARQGAAAGAGAGGRAMPNFDARVLEPESWASTKPAYTAILPAPDGRLWVTLSRPAGSKTAQLDVLNTTGALVAHVQLGPGERLVGFGRGTVYTVRVDEDDLKYLRRYTLPNLR